jgi:trehalose 6-phosphate phosphatase
MPLLVGPEIRMNKSLDSNSTIRNTIFNWKQIKERMPVAHPEQSASLPPFSRNWALFLDIDGTILELAETPERVVVTAGLRALMRELNAAAGGAFALISGRSLGDIDALFDIPGLAAAGLHGVECRTSDGVTHVQSVDDSLIQSFRGRLRAYTDRYPGLLLEDKKLSIAIHFRRASNLQAEVERILRETIAGHDSAFHIQSGKMIAEIKPRGSDKGFAIRRFMQSPPFQSRMPLFIGDDVTDEDGFRAVNELRGVSVKVGHGPSNASHRMEHPADVIEWLRSYLNFLEAR